MPGLPDYRTALERRAAEVQEKLECSPIIGIVGMGGIAKTSVARQLLKTLSEQFDYTCFVENVKGIKVHRLMERVLNHFLQRGTKVDQNSLEWSNIRTKKCLMTMDDVNSEDQLRTLPRLDKFGNGNS